MVCGEWGNEWVGILEVKIALARVKTTTLDRRYFFLVIMIVVLCNKLA